MGMLIISGEFEDSDIIAFAMLLRTVTRHNDRRYQFWITKPRHSHTTETIEQLLPETTIHRCQ